MKFLTGTGAHPWDRRSPTRNRIGATSRSQVQQARVGRGRPVASSQMGGTLSRIPVLLEGRYQRVIGAREVGDVVERFARDRRRDGARLVPITAEHDDPGVVIFHR
jgi:hypothetical protein